MGVSVMISLIVLCGIGVLVAGVSIQKRDVSELNGKSDQLQFARTSSRLTNRYLPPQSSAQPQDTYPLTAPVDISSKSGDIEPTTATSVIDNSRYENHSHRSESDISQPTTNLLSVNSQLNEFKSSGTESFNHLPTSGISNGVSSHLIKYKASEIDTPQYDSQNQIYVNGIPQSNINQVITSASLKSPAQYEKQSQTSLNKEVVERFGENGNGNGLILQSKTPEQLKLNGNSGLQLNYLPPQTQTLPKPIRLLEKSGDIGTSYISPIDVRPGTTEQLFTSNPESYTFSPSNSKPITTSNFSPSSAQELPDQFSDPNSFYLSTKSSPFKIYGTPNLQSQRLSYSQNIAEVPNGATKDVEVFQPVTTVQTKLVGQDTRGALQHEVVSETYQFGQPNGYTRRIDPVAAITPQELRKSQFGYDVQGTETLNNLKLYSTDNLRSDNGYRYFKPPNNIGLPVITNYQQNGRDSSSSILIPSLTSQLTARFTENQNIPHSGTFQSATGASSSENGYRYQNPESDLRFKVEAAGNQQILDYQNRPGITQNLNGLRSGILSSENRMGNLGVAGDHQSNYQEQTGFTRNLNELNVASHQNLQFGATSDLNNALLRPDSHSSYSISNSAYKYVRPAIGLAAQNLETYAQPAITQSQPFDVSEISYRIKTPTTVVSGNDGDYKYRKDENLSNQGAYQQGSGQTYDSSGGYVY